MHNNVLEINQVHKSLGGPDILRGMDLNIQKGEWVALIGPNGCGKTTLFRCITGIYTLDRGTIKIGQNDINTDPYAAKSQLGFACEINALPDELTGNQLHALILKARKIETSGDNCQALWGILEISRYADNMISQYSSGMKQKLSLALALINDPTVLLLDETLNYLDPVSAYDVKNFLTDCVAQNQFSILMATHNMDTAMHLCHRTLMMESGQIQSIWAPEAGKSGRYYVNDMERGIVEKLRGEALL